MARAPGLPRTAPLPQSDPCIRQPPAVPPRLVAGVLLAVLVVRLMLDAWHAQLALFPLLPPILAALLLGACLWWVACRQVGAEGAALALALYGMTPLLGVLALQQVSTLCAALGLFAMVYTAVGVAHALDGPRRKWPRRIALMSALVGFTALAQPAAGAVGLLLSLAAMLYLARERVRVLSLLFALWAGVDMLAATVAYKLGVKGSLLAVLWPAQGLLPFPAQLKGFGLGAGVAAIAALALWCVAGRSRYFGNTAPLLGALLLSAAGWRLGVLGVAWALPFGLLFLAGVFADGLESRARRVWLVLGVGTWVLQILARLHT